MKMTPRWQIAAGLVVVAGLQAASVQAADLVVVEAHGIQYAEGQVLDGSKILKLEVGQSVSVVAQNGQITTIDGPYDKAPAPDQGALTLAASLQVLTAGRTSDTSSLGAVRKGETEHEVPTSNDINIADSGDRCITAGSPVILWRPTTAASPQTVTLTPGDHSFQAAAKWPANSDRLRIEGGVPFPDSTIYTATLNGIDSTLVFHVIPAAIDKPAMVAAWMLKKHCTAQARALVRTL